MTIAEIYNSSWSAKGTVQTVYSKSDSLSLNTKGHSHLIGGKISD